MGVPLEVSLGFPSPLYPSYHVYAFSLLACYEPINVKPERKGGGAWGRDFDRKIMRKTRIL